LEDVIMPKTMRRASLLIALGACLVLPAGAMAQAETSPPDAQGVTPAQDPTATELLPRFDGLAWYRSVDLTGEEIQSTLPEDQVAAWGATLDHAGATFDQLEYAYHSAFDPDTLPEVAGLATVRIVGVEEDVLRAAVVQDIVAQVVATGSPAPEPQETTMAGKDVTVVGLPAALGHKAAIVYAHGDIGYVLLMSADLATAALEQLP
jgi:hypothetical protein